MIKCIRCGSEENDQSSVCSRCGFDLNAWRAAEGAARDVDSSNAPSGESFSEPSAPSPLDTPVPGQADAAAASLEDTAGIADTLSGSGAYDSAAAHSTDYVGLSTPAGDAPKPKRSLPKGLAWKIPAALAGIAVALGALTVLGYYTFLPVKAKLLAAETMTFMARYDEMNDLFTDYEKNVLDPVYHQGTAHSAQFGVTISEESLAAFGLDESSAAAIAAAAGSATFDYSAASEMKAKKATMDFAVSASGNSLASLQVRLDGNQMRMRVPELNATWLEFDASRYSSQLQDLADRFDASRTAADGSGESSDVEGALEEGLEAGMDQIDGDLSAIPGLDSAAAGYEIDPWVSAQIYDTVKIDRTALRNLLSRYVQLVVATVPDKNMVRDGSETIEVLGENVRCTKYVVTLDAATQQEIAIALLDEMKSDEKLYGFTVGAVKDALNVIADSSPEMKDDIQMVTMMLSFATWKQGIITAKDSVESSWPEGMPDIDIEVYVRNTDVVRHAIVIPQDFSVGGGAIAFDWLRSGKRSASGVSLIGNEQVVFSLSGSRTEKARNAVDHSLDMHAGMVGQAEMLTLVGTTTETTQNGKDFESLGSLDLTVVDPMGDGTSSIKLNLASTGTLAKDKVGTLTASDHDLQVSLTAPELPTGTASIAAGLALTHDYDAPVAIPDMSTDKVLTVEGASDEDLSAYGEEFLGNLEQLEAALGQ